jgi:hypothetical protein
MSYRILWAPSALHTFYRLPVPIHSATVVDRAVIRFATEGEGHIESVAPYHRLRAGVFDVVLVVDRAARTLVVQYVHRARR